MSSWALKQNTLTACGLVLHWPSVKRHSTGYLKNNHPIKLSIFSNQNTTLNDLFHLLEVCPRLPRLLQVNIDWSQDASLQRTMHNLLTSFVLCKTEGQTKYLTDIILALLQQCQHAKSTTSPCSSGYSQSREFCRQLYNVTPILKMTGMAIYLDKLSICMTRKLMIPTEVAGHWNIAHNKLQILPPSVKCTKAMQELLRAEVERLSSVTCVALVSILSKLYHLRPCVHRYCKATQRLHLCSHTALPLLAHTQKCEDQPLPKVEIKMINMQTFGWPMLRIKYSRYGARG